MMRSEAIYEQFRKILDTNPERAEKFARRWDMRMRRRGREWRLWFD